MADRPSIVLRTLRKRFGARVGLAGVDLALDGAQLVGVVGPDGAGKTTLLRALAGLLEVEADTAQVLGVDLRGDVRALKAQVGYVPQAFSLPRDLSVLENLRFTARLHRLPDDVFRRRSTALLERTGLAPFTARPAAALSGGMKQKLAISCALLPDPALLLLDEPTAGMGLAERSELMEMMVRHTTQREITLLFVEHDIDIVFRFADRITVMARGKVFAEGTPAEIASHAAVQEIYLGTGHG